MNAVASDTARAIRKISASEGPNARWLRENSAVTRRAIADLARERAVLASVGGESL
jgi:hypothetical protein